MHSYLESKDLLEDVEGTAVKPPDPPTFPKGQILSDDEEAQVEKFEERL